MADSLWQYLILWKNHHSTSTTEQIIYLASPLIMPVSLIFLWENIGSNHENDPKAFRSNVSHLLHG